MRHPKITTILAPLLSSNPRKMIILVLTQLNSKIQNMNKKITVKDLII